MAGRPRAATDLQVFAAVGDVVSTHGPSGATLARIGRAAGLSAAALVQRFGSKHDLLVAFACAAPAETSALFDRAEANATSPLGCLRAALTELVPPVRTPGELANHLAFLQLDLTDPDLRRPAVAQTRTIHRRLTKLLDAAVAGGELLPTVPQHLARTVQIAWNGALITWAVDGKGSARRWVANAVEAVLDPYVC